MRHEEETSGWRCRACAERSGSAFRYAQDVDAYCKVCNAPQSDAERLATAVAELSRTLRAGRASPPPESRDDEATVGPKEAARLLHTTVKGIYNLHARGKLPPSIGPSTRLLWRRGDLVGSEQWRAPSPGKGARS